MAGMVGTIVNVIDFLSPKEIKLTVQPDVPQSQNITLRNDRCYFIPAFQRELRWDENNLKMLLGDLSRGSKFLGNIILTINSHYNCEIIDGQQRTTIIMLIVSCIKKKYGEQIDIPALCPLVNESFTGFQSFLNKKVEDSEFLPAEWAEIVSSDHYHQIDRLNKLWSTIDSSELLADRFKAKSLLDNLRKSELNIIASYSDDVNDSIQYFLDVNLKGIRLDTEDIFKGYLFSQDSREQTRALWNKNKCDVLRLNDVSESSKEKRYPLMKLYEHFFNCDLYRPRTGNSEYEDLHFGENFCLTRSFKIGDTIFYEGSHLIEAIQDQTYLFDALNRLSKSINIIIDIIENEGPSSMFRAQFLCASKVDDTDIRNAHAMLKKILLDKEIIPKILALKYILTCFDGNQHEKAAYKTVYSVFCAAVLFSIFANKKESDTFYNIVKSEDWTQRIDEWLFDYISSHGLTKGKILAAYKCDETEDNRDQQIRCKSLAAIYNYFKIKKNAGKYMLSVADAAALNRFFSDSTTYSIEHFIIGNSGKMHIKTDTLDFEYKYPSQIQRYKNSLFNYIFIPQKLNDSLSNNNLFAKVADLQMHIQQLECNFSQNYLGILGTTPRTCFPEYPSLEAMGSYATEIEARKELDSYFTKTFPEEFLQFSISVVKNLSWESN